MKLKNMWKRFWTLDVHNHEGFTLVELIIVIAILAILSTGAIAGYSAYVESANKTADKALMDKLAADRYDLVLVNIVADVIIGLCPILPRFMDENTLLICSGILDTRLGDVTAALEKAGLVITKTKAKEDWRCVSVRRRML